MLFLLRIDLTVDNFITKWAVADFLTNKKYMRRLYTPAYSDCSCLYLNPTDRIMPSWPIMHATNSFVYL